MASNASPRILYYETSAYAPSSGHFLEALRESGLEFRFFDEAPFLAGLRRSRWHRAAYRFLGRRPLGAWALNRALLQAATEFRPDILLVTKGPFVWPDTLRRIKRETGAQLVNFATDDPFNPANRTPDLVAAIPCYDLYLSTKRAIIPDLLAAGATRVEYLPFGYKPTEHFPEMPVNEEERRRFESDVAFIGAADADRVPLLERLAMLPGVRLALYGAGWERSPSLRLFARGFVYGRDYRLAATGAAINLGFVRRANRDGHAMRSFELPACGAFVLAEDTEEHRVIFQGSEAVAFVPRDEALAACVREWLAAPERRRAVAAEGLRRITSGGHRYADRLRQIINLLCR